MEKGFALLEEKVKKAADLVTRLRRENGTLHDEAGRLKARVQELERAAHAAPKERGPSPEEVRRVSALEQELKTLRQEREDIRGRIARLVDALESLE
jgi:predicted RNase H-like nuclease (RuvC/YqgF family)